MPKFTVTMNILVDLTVEVEAGDAENAYDRARLAVHDVLDGGNIEAHFHATELTEVSEAEETV